MKKLFLYTVLVLASSALVTSTSCLKVAVPVAAFSISADTILAGQSVDFTDESTGNPNFWSWTLDGSDIFFSGEQHPQNVVYTYPGVYDVTLYVENENGEDMITKTACIVVAQGGGGGGGKNCGGTTSVADVEGNVYKVTQIGGKCWMAENLRTSHFANGEAIPNVTDEAQWELSTLSPAWCYYMNNGSLNNPYGKLYNWSAVIDIRRICPNGWHVPTDQDWKDLETALGMSSSELALEDAWRGTSQNVGGKLKATTNWDSPNTGATDESGFSAVAGGDRSDQGRFDYMGRVGTYWTSEEGPQGPWAREMWSNNGGIYRAQYFWENGFCVRCVRD